MQLIDVLETRNDKVEIIESVDNAKLVFVNQNSWFVDVEGSLYELTEPALDTLLNLLRIPIKYVKRCTDEPGGSFLAEQSINYWMSQYGELSFLIDSELKPVIAQIFPGKRMYLPGMRVNDLIIEYLDGNVSVSSYVQEDDVFNALYLTDKEVDVNGKKMLFGVRVLYSDCFTITPRFDGVLYEPTTGGIFCWPTTGRKFRVASNTLPQIMEQIEDFLDLSIDGLSKTLKPALERAEEVQSLIEADGFTKRLCSDLRLNQKVKVELDALFNMMNYTLIELVSIIAAYTSTVEDSKNIDLNVARDIQIALSTYLVKGSFK